MWIEEGERKTKIGKRRRRRRKMREDGKNDGRARKRGKFKEVKLHSRHVGRRG